MFGARIQFSAEIALADLGAEVGRLSDTDVGEQSHHPLPKIHRATCVRMIPHLSWPASASPVTLTEFTSCRDDQQKRAFPYRCTPSWKQRQRLPRLLFCRCQLVSRLADLRQVAVWAVPEAADLGLSHAAE